MSDDGRTHPPVIVVSDGTGASAERLVRSMIVQHGDPEVPVIKLPGAGSIEAIDHATGLVQLQLRSERAGKRDGRTYTITITATDESGNSSTAVLDILAPHDRRKK